MALLLVSAFAFLSITAANASTIVFTDPVQITNSQTSATPSPFQQVINMTNLGALSVSSLLRSDLGNIRFCADSACSTMFDAWLENCKPSCNRNATSITLWVKLPNGIAASTTSTIYFVIYDTTQTFSSPYWGEAPQITPASYVKEAEGVGGTATSETATIQKVTAGDVLIVAGECLQSSGTGNCGTSVFNTPTDNESDTFTQITSAGTTSTSIQTWYAVANGGSTKVTLSTSGSSIYMDPIVAEVRGVSTNSFTTASGTSLSGACAPCQTSTSINPSYGLNLEFVDVYASYGFTYPVTYHAMSTNRYYGGAYSWDPTTSSTQLQTTDGGGGATGYTLVYIGLNPSGSWSYAGNDNAANVFPSFYDNFAGTSLGGNWNTNYCSSTCPTIYVNNGVTMTSPNISGDYVGGKLNSYQTTGLPVMIDTEFANLQGYGAGIVQINGTYPGTGTNTLDAEDRPGDGGCPTWCWDWWTCHQVGGGTAVNATRFILSLAVVNGNDFVMSNYNKLFSDSCNAAAGMIGIIQVDNARDVAFWQWMRVRAYPPNGVMPSTVVGVTQPIKATLQGTGLTQTVSISGCGASPNSFSGNGVTNYIVVEPSCNLTLGGLTSGSSGTYIWQQSGTTSFTIKTCGSTTVTCQNKSSSYMKYVRPVNNANNYVNLTSTVASVYVNLFNATHNALAGGACGPSANASCTAYNGILSYQFNIAFPKYQVRDPGGGGRYIFCSTIVAGCAPYTLQATIEFENGGTCVAKPQGASSSPPAQNVTNPAVFACKNIMGPADSFKWTVDSTGGAKDNLTDVKFRVNNTDLKTWTPVQMFNDTGWPGVVSFTDVYAQGQLVGADTVHPFTNLEGGQGFMTYSGVSAFNMGSHCVSCTVIVTGEHSNVVYSSLPSSSPFNQTYFAGVFVDSQIPAGSSASGSGGHLYSPANIVGKPDLNYAELVASSSQSNAIDEGEFAGLYNGTLALYAASVGGASTHLWVQTSADGQGWGTVFNSTWNVGTFRWIIVASATKVQYVKVGVFYSSGTSDIDIDAVSIFSGSFVQFNSGSGHSVPGVAPTNPGNIVGINTTTNRYVELRAPNSSNIAWVEGSYKAQYGGSIFFWGHSASGYTSRVYLNYSLDEQRWTTLGPYAISSTSDVITFTPGFHTILYVRIIVKYVPVTGTPGDFFLNAVYIA